MITLRKIQGRCAPLRGSTKNMQSRIFYDSGESTFTGQDRLGKSKKLWIKSSDRPGVEVEVDFADVLIRE